MIEQAWNYKSVVAKDSNNTGGSGSGSGEASSIEYLDVRNVDDTTKQMLVAASYLVKMPLDQGGIYVTVPISNGLGIEKILNDTNYVAVPISIQLKEGFSINDLLIQQGVSLNNIPRITKEQFYNLEAEL